MLESQRRLAALGLFRRVRITELPRTGSLTRDVLVEVEEAATTTIDYGGGVEVGRIAGGRGRRQRRDEQLDIGAARLLRDQPPQPVGQEPIGHAVRPRHAAAARPTIRHDPEPTRRLRLQRLSRPVHVPRAARRSARTGDAQVTAFIEQGRRSSFNFNRRGVTRRLRAAPRRLHGHRPLHLRLHQAVRRADRGRGSAADRSPVSAGQAVEDLRRRAARLARRRARSAARRGGRPRWLGGGARPRIGSRLRQDVRAGLRLSPPAGPPRRDRGRRPARPRRGLFAGRSAAARDRRRTARIRR